MLVLWLSVTLQVLSYGDAMTTIYQKGTSDQDLPECTPKAVCNKVDLYDESDPWLEKICRCTGDHECSSNVFPDDGYTLVDNVRQYKICEPVANLPVCGLLNDVAITLKSVERRKKTKQIVRCACPAGSQYFIKNATLEIDILKNEYDFACEPAGNAQDLCLLKDPCRRFSVRRRHQMPEDVSSVQLCQCPSDYECSTKHTGKGVEYEESEFEGFTVRAAYCIEVF